MTTNWKDLLRDYEESKAKSNKEAQVDYFTKRYGQGPILPAIDGRWEQLPEWMRTSAVFKISASLTADDTEVQRKAKIKALLEDGDYDCSHELPKTADDAEVVSSLDLDTYMHRPVLDIDIPAALIPSSTPGHHHLYIDKPMTPLQYVDLLKALTAAGIIEEGYAAASIERGYTSARLPWVKKPSAADV
ncbi:hypothetical protein [Pseudarthrobacter sp. S6]|uniref:hypothetical protein n=1 Tax=Pseudarthrobacter sp. S6 TaxID=3418420 RepID=UPI003CFB15EB